jgi:tyrosinase
MDRRTFIAGATTAVAAPFFLSGASAATPRMRRDVQSLDPSDPFFSKYAEAVKKMHELPDGDPRNWRNQALIHINHCPHGRSSFVHWHRHYILNYELICGQLIGDPDFALAYWNWSAKKGIIPDPFYDVDQLNVQFWHDPSNAQSNNWGPATVRTVGTRALPKGQGLQEDPNAGQVFTQDFIDAVQQEPQFAIFTGELEGSPHNSGHVISGGTNGHMRNGMSPLDPIFWLHHCNIDRIWAEWQTAGNSTPPFNLSYNNQFVNGNGQPITASSASALDFAAMNYTYDTLSSTVVAQQIERLGLQAARPAPVPLTAAAAAPRILAAVSTTQTVVPAVETRFPIAAPDLAPNLFRQRSFMALKAPTVQRVAIGTGRILAKFSDVTAPDSEAPVICKVFVNHPNLSPTTPSTDPLCGGSFSFFGAHGEMHGHNEFYVNITGPLRVLFKDGAVDPAKLNIQLMAAAPEATGGAGSDTSFKVGKVELIST